MTAVRRMLVLVSASLLMAATAVADNGITVEGAVCGSTEPIEAGSLGPWPPAPLRLHTAGSVFSRAARDRRIVQFQWGTGIEHPERPTSWVTTACEFGAGLMGAAALGAGGAYGGVVLVSGGHPEFTGDVGDAIMVLFACVGVIVGAPIGASLGTYLVGEAWQQDGEFGSTYLGALAGTCLGLPLYVVGAIPGAAIGATISYNKSSANYYGERRVPGAAELCSVKDRGGGIHPSLDVRLLSVRF